VQRAEYPEVAPDFGHWLAGFIDGEGCFIVARAHKRTNFMCRFQLTLRGDDAAILREIRAATGIGQLRTAHDKRKYVGNLCVVWQLQARADCLRLVELLDRFPLRAKKARDYAIWRRAVVVWGTAAKGYGAGRRNLALWEQMAAFQAELGATRAWAAPHSGLPEVVEIDPIADLDQLVLGEGVEPGDVIQMPAAED
jgi:hypothetical protein